jgi:hypothetical protein
VFAQIKHYLGPLSQKMTVENEAQVQYRSKFIFGVDYQEYGAPEWHHHMGCEKARPSCCEECTRVQLKHDNE